MEQEFHASYYHLEPELLTALMQTSYYACNPFFNRYIVLSVRLASWTTIRDHLPGRWIARDQIHKVRFDAACNIVLNVRGPSTRLRVL
jgi:hypothetical protein